MPKLKNTRHFAEIMASNTFMKYPDAKEEALTFLSNKSAFGDMWPDWCYFPMAATYSILTHGIGSRVPMALQLAGGVEALSKFTAAIIWSPFKGVYRYDPTLAAELIGQGLAGDIPFQALMRLPEPCVFVETQLTYSGKRFDGFFAWLENDVGEGGGTGMELRLLFLTRDQSVWAVPVILGGDVEHGVFALIESGIQRYTDAVDPSYGEDMGYSPSDIASAINLLLYLCSDEPDVCGAYPLRSRPAGSSKEAKTASYWDVGVRIGSAIRRYRNEEESQEREFAPSADRSSPRPHIRRAHWHHFWSGPKNGERKLSLKWLPPIPVKINDAGDIPTVIRPVK